MRIIKKISNVNRKIPKIVRFIIGLIILNVPPIMYLNKAGSKITPVYVAIIFLLVNAFMLLAYYKVKEIEVAVPGGKIRIKK